MARDANPKHPWLYVSGYDSNNVVIYDLNRFGPSQIGTIVTGIDGPCGISVDSAGTLYVATPSEETSPFTRPDKQRRA